MAQEFNYNESAMKRYLKTFQMSRQKKNLCIAGIEMYLFTKEDIQFVADESTTELAASNRLRYLVSTM